MTTQTAPTRDQFGALLRATIPTEARDLVRIASERGKIPAAYDLLTWDRKGRASGSAVHHEIYDISPDARRALVCVRTTEGNKYGVRTTDKSYFVLARHGRGVRVIPANKAVAAKAAKASGEQLGIAIAVALGKLKCPVKAGTVRTGYKLLVRAENGYTSAWDGSAWTIGKPRIEAASDDHSGGFYYYASLPEALAAAAANDVFGTARDHHRLAIVEVEAAGRHYEHQGAHGVKLCATKITPLRDIGTTL